MIVNVVSCEIEDGTAEASDASLSQWVFWTICELMSLTVSLGTVRFLLESVTGHLKSRDREVIALLPVFSSRPV